jgi:hypothetical protein
VAYRVMLSTAAKENFNRLADDHKQFVGDAILNLKSRPLVYSKQRPVPPGLPGARIHEMTWDHDREERGSWYRFLILISIDEPQEQVNIIDIIHMEYQWPPPRWPDPEDPGDAPPR